MQFGPDFSWLKRFMPRGLYGRAALILLLPVFTLVLVVTVTFLQRHFEGVTRQMTASVAPGLEFVADSVDQAPDAATARELGTRLGAQLGFAFDMPGEGLTDSRLYYDVSGRIVADELRDRVSAVQAVALSDIKLVRLGLAGRHGRYTLSFPRARVSASNPHQLLVLLGFTAALMTVIAGLFLRNQLRPIRQLGLAAEDYGRGRITPYRPGGAAEIRSAGAAFVDMRNRLERLAESRGIMLTGISHDLRTPLTRLQLSLSMLSPDLPPDEEEIAAMQRDVSDMTQMVNAFLAFARDAAQDGPAETVALRPFLERIVQDAHRAGHNIAWIDETTKPGDRVPAASLRPDLMRRAIENLINNAVRHGTRAELRLSSGPRHLRIAVEDDGPGIPEDLREEAMRPFSRLDKARSRPQGGGAAGLGLAIAADAARSHGGQLRLDQSPHLGGLRAEITLVAR
ncbi:ATP-binding protein [Paracoccus jeotgali]|uniref:ATP-binding protein n=1 Tax=Paracoccus jeotgali TaxID=2065379 RepID=UPI0028ADCD61|nr:ATP-binding protein [Paracoccus jeotgali]